MKFGLREICDVVLKARAPMKIGRKVFYKDEPVLYFDTLKTSTLEGASSTVYATGGRGNSRLVAWDGERTITFTMEDALISPESLAILSGAGLIEASPENTIKQHIIEQTDDVVYNESGKLNGGQEIGECAYIYLKNKPYVGPKKAGSNEFIKNEHYIYVMGTKLGEANTEPYLPVIEEPQPVYWGPSEDLNADGTRNYGWIAWTQNDPHPIEKWRIVVAAHSYGTKSTVVYGNDGASIETKEDAVDYKFNNTADEQLDHIFNLVFNNATVIVDYYTEKTANTKQIEITADTFGGNFYLEASTLFRTQDGVDLPAEFIIPNCKVQSNFTFSMAASGDPSTFTFTMDAFPAYTRFDSTKKVLCAIQLIEDVLSDDLVRNQTFHDLEHNAFFDDAIHNY